MSELLFPDASIPALRADLFDMPTQERRTPAAPAPHRPRFLLLHDRLVDVMEELFKFTLLTRDLRPCLVDRYSERKESAEELSKRVNQRAL